MISKVGSLEEKVKLPPTETISRCYQQQGNRKVIRILTVAVYVFCVSLAAIMLSLYYIFIWDPTTIRPFVTKVNNCEKIVIPEKIAIRLLNSSEITAEQFYKRILDQYRILNQLQQQRQQFLQKQHIQLQQLAAGNKFQEIFATATIIQANPNDPIKKHITPTNGTFLLDPRPIVVGDMGDPIYTRKSPSTVAKVGVPLTRVTETVPSIVGASVAVDPAIVAVERVPTSDTTVPIHTKRKSHRKHYSHHRHNLRKSHKKTQPPIGLLEHSKEASTKILVQTPLNPPPPISVVHEPYTAMPIPLILNSKEDKLPYFPFGDQKTPAIGSRIWSSSTGQVDATYDSRTYLNPYLNGELIFEK